MPGVASEVQPESVYEVQQAESADRKAREPYDFLPAESGNCRQRNTDLKHGHGIGKAVMVFQALIRFFVSWPWPLLRISLPLR